MQEEHSASFFSVMRDILRKITFSVDQGFASIFVHNQWVLQLLEIFSSCTIYLALVGQEIIITDENKNSIKIGNIVVWFVYQDVKWILLLLARQRNWRWANFRLWNLLSTASTAKYFSRTETLGKVFNCESISLKGKYK